jgi:hypothetical protein
VPIWGGKGPIYGASWQGLAALFQPNAIQQEPIRVAHEASGRCQERQPDVPGFQKESLWLKTHLQSTPSMIRPVLPVILNSRVPGKCLDHAATLWQKLLFCRIVHNKEKLEVFV